MKLTRHTLNGKLRGWWAELPDGRQAYIAERIQRHLDWESRTWMIEVWILKEAAAKDAAVIILVRRGKRREFLVTQAKDFFESPFAVEKWGDIKMRGLPPARFKVSPERSEAAIERSVRIK